MSYILLSNSPRLIPHVIYPAAHELARIDVPPENIMLTPAVLRLPTPRVPRRSLTLAVLLTITSYSALAAAQTKLQDAPASCEQFGDGFKSDIDLIAVNLIAPRYLRLVEMEDFRQLDCIANSARTSKVRFSGGKWQLHILYSGVSEVPGHATEEDWNNLISHLEKWLSANPKSITAPVALAEAYINFAWHARGDGYSDTVTQSGWKLFGQRIEHAKKILDDASSLAAKCPHWYLAMQSVARAEGWDVGKSTELVNEATAVAPDYYYFYRSLAEYMLPKWGGEEGDAAKFAEQSANRLGGTNGDILYFRIGERLVCPCADEHEFNRLSWRDCKGIRRNRKSIRLLYFRSERYCSDGNEEQ